MQLGSTSGYPSSSMVRNDAELAVLGGAEREDLGTLLGNANNAISDILSRYSIILHSDGPVTFTGTELQIETGQNIYLKVYQNSTGNVHSYNIPSTETLGFSSSGSILYAVIDRAGLGTGDTPSFSLTSANSNLFIDQTVIPAITNSNLLYIPIAVRLDNADTTQYLHWFVDGSSWKIGTASSLGEAKGGIEKWKADTKYFTDSIVWVEENNVIYRCDTVGNGHTSSADFFADLESEYWIAISGSGGGGSVIVDTLTDRSEDTVFSAVTPLDFTLVEDGLTDETNSTANLNKANSEYFYEFASADTLQTTNLYCDYYLDSDLNNKSIELWAFWQTPDLVATYEVSADNGKNFTEVTMESISGSNTYIGTLTLPEFTTNSVSLGSALNEGVNLELNDSDAQRAALVVNLTETSDLIKYAISYNKVGSPLGSFIVTVNEDNSGLPGAELCRSDLIDISSLTSGEDVVIVSLSKTHLKRNTNYHLQIIPDSAYRNSYVAATTALELTAGTGTSNSSVYDGSVWSATSDTALTYGLTGYKQSLIVKVTAATADTKLLGLGILYAQDSVSSITGSKQIQYFSFSGDDDVTEFEITNFLVDQDILKFYDILTGQVYPWRSFDLEANKAIFPSGTFYAPGVEYLLKAEQIESGSFDNSDKNAALLADNGLGSANLDIDRSSAGKGFKLRSLDGQLWEITVLNDGSLNTEKVG